MVTGLRVRLCDVVTVFSSNLKQIQIQDNEFQPTDRCYMLSRHFGQRVTKK